MPIRQDSKLAAERAAHKWKQDLKIVSIDE
jgi:hypothetical protein